MKLSRWINTVLLFAGLLGMAGLAPSTGLAQEDLGPRVDDRPRFENENQIRPIPQKSSEMQRGVHCPSQEELDEWFKPIDRIRLSSRAVDGALPIDCSANLFHSPNYDQSQSAPTRDWALTEFHWQASNLAAQPAYFDDVPLERYGQTISPALQPGISMVKFFGSVPIIPYKIGIDRTHDLIYTLGYYRPGSPAPQVKQVLPWEWDAALFQAGVTSGLIFILP